MMLNNDKLNISAEPTGLEMLEVGKFYYCIIRTSIDGDNNHYLVKRLLRKKFNENVPLNIIFGFNVYAEQSVLHLNAVVHKSRCVCYEVFHTEEEIVNLFPEEFI